MVNNEQIYIDLVLTGYHGVFLAIPFPPTIQKNQLGQSRGKRI